MQADPRFLIACAVLGAASAAARAEQHIACPSEIAASQVQVEGATGWIGFYTPELRLKLKSAGAMLGPLERMGMLQGEVTQQDDTMLHRYAMTGGPGAGMEKWIVCSYEGNANQALRLPPATSECIVAYRRDRDREEDESSYPLSAITCK